MKTCAQHWNHLTAAGQVEHQHVALDFAREPGNSGVLENDEASIGRPVGRDLESTWGQRFLWIVLARPADADLGCFTPKSVQEPKRLRIRRPNGSVPDARLQRQFAHG